jgi:eukaryotic-like serine/threonine-protein kinase
VAADDRPSSDAGAGPSDRLDSWKEIASYLKRSVRTVTRWERDEGLPVHRHVHSKAGTVYARKGEVDAWWAERGKRLEKVEAQRPGKRGRRAAAVLAGAILLFGLLAWLALRSDAPRAEAQLVPLTSYTGIEGPPSLSPDGNQVAFERGGDLYVKQVDGEALVRLTSTTAEERNPAWSPDSRQIAFVRDGTAVFVVSPLGGDERRIAATRASLLLKAMAWTPDGRWLVVSEMTSPVGASLFRVHASSGEKTRLTFPPEPSIGDGWPAVSPDGRTLAFARYAQDTSARIFAMPLAGGEPSPLTTDGAPIFGLAFTPDASQIVFASDRGGSSRLWQLSLAGRRGHDPAPLPRAGENARFPSISRGAGALPVRLAYQRFEENLDIRRAWLAIEGRARALRAGGPFIASTRSEDHPRYSPDGRRIAFVSKRSGTWQVWVCEADGSRPVRLTSMEGPIVLAPQWSPDGRRMAFFATGASGNYLAYTIGAEGGPPSRLRHDDRGFEALPVWSRDGRWIYLASGRSGSLQIWKMPAGGGELVQVTRGGGAEAAESMDGRFLYYTKVSEVGPGLWRVPTEGGSEVCVLERVRFGYWKVASDGIYYLDFDTAPLIGPALQFFEFSTGRVSAIGTLEKSVHWANNPGFDVSPDEGSLLYTSLESTEADLMLIDHFQPGR